MKEFIGLLFQLPIWAQWLIGIMFPILSGLVIYAGRNYLRASEEFKSIVYTKLEGIYPSIELYLTTDEINTKIQQSIPQIQTAVNNFKHFLPFFFRGRLEITAKNYYKTARETDWYQCLNFDMPKAVILTPKERFKKAVDELLKYAK